MVRNESEKSKETTRDGAIRRYKEELKVDPTYDLGMQSPSRARLRVLAEQSVIDSTKKMKKKYSFSQGSSQQSALKLEGQSHTTALKMLMKERLIVSRLGFPEKAKELDEQIDVMRKKAITEKKKEEKEMTDQRMTMLYTSQSRKENRLEYTLSQETQVLMERFAAEERHLADRQEQDFVKVRGRAYRSHTTAPAA